jgi:hypothetical protein
VAWRPVPRRQKDGTIKVSKQPFTPGTLAPADVSDPETWGAFAEAVAAVVAGDAKGVGFVFAPTDPYFGIDLDKCVDSRTRALTSAAEEIVRRFGTYVEVSPSGTGLHLIGRGVLPSGGKRRGGIEVYDRGRYFTITGDVLPEYTTIRDCGTELAAWHRETFGAPEPATPPLAVPMDAAEVEARLRAERNGQAVRLLSGDASGHPTLSHARWALANKSLFYTDDPDIVEGILLQSGLFGPDDDEGERERRARYDATKAASTYAGHRYGARHNGSRPRALPDTSGADRILANDALGWARLTAWAVVRDLADRIARGEQPEADGFRTPSARYAEITGQKEATVARHLRELAKLGLVNKRVIRTRTQRTDMLEIVDGETGEVWHEREVVRGTRDANFVHLGDEGLSGLVARLVSYAGTPTVPASDTSVASHSEHSPLVDSGAMADGEPAPRESSNTSEKPPIPVFTSGASDIPQTVGSHASGVSEPGGGWVRARFLNR